MLKQGTRTATAPQEQTPELWAAGTGGPIMPWNGPLQRLLDNLSGPTAQTLGMLAFVPDRILLALGGLADRLQRLGVRRGRPDPCDEQEEDDHARKPIQHR